MESLNYEVIQLNVERCMGNVRLDPQRMKRNDRRNGATVKAAVRLAAYRLRKYARNERMTRVSDIDIMTNQSQEEFIRGGMSVAATARFIRLPDGVVDPNFQVPMGSSVVRMVVPTTQSPR